MKNVVPSIFFLAGIIFIGIGAFVKASPNHAQHVIISLTLGLSMGSFVVSIVGFIMEAKNELIRKMEELSKSEKNEP